MSKLYHSVQLPLFVLSKVCAKCHTEKPLEDFNRNCHKKDGHVSRCKDCIKKFHYRNPEKKREYDLIRNANRKEQKREESRRYNQANREKRRERGHAHYKANRERIRARNHAHYEANKIKYYEKYQRRVARQNGVTVEKVSYQRILERDGMWCYICERDILPGQKIHFDHVIPLTRGGSHSEANIKVTHQVCNLHKHDNLIEEMADFQRRGPD